MRALLLLLALQLAGCAINNITRDGNVPDLMLRGHDPTSYFTAGGPVPGSADHRVAHAHGTYYFASAESRARFVADPGRYSPQYGGFCAKGVAYAIRAGGDPLVYEIKDGRLFIFAVPYARAYWQTDPADFIAKADHYWRTELADAPATWTNLKRWLFRVPHYKSYPEEFADYTRRTGKPSLGSE